MPTPLCVDEFIKTAPPILDVRSPSEYQQGHIPGSYSLPLFTDEERVLIGTAYKQQSRETAIDLGLQIVGPKLLKLVQNAKKLIQRDAKVLCWRGGMRSGFVARLLESLEFNTYTLQGGYKAFRRWSLQRLKHLSSSTQLYVLSGLTGSGKTSILHYLHQMGEQVIDLEKIANHRGSAFGMLGLSDQPSQEHFENQLVMIWNQLDLSKPIWIEDESRMIGKCRIPSELYTLMSGTPLFYIDVPQEERIHYLLCTYGHASIEQLVRSTQRIARRLGSQLTKEIIHLLQEDQKEKAFTLLLSYYDKTYYYYLSKKSHIRSFSGISCDHKGWASYLKNLTERSHKQGVT